MEKKIEEMRKALERAEALAYVYAEIKSRMEWDTMTATDNRDEDGNVIFDEPDEGDWRYTHFKAYQEVLKTIEKMLK